MGNPLKSSVGRNQIPQNNNMFNLFKQFQEFRRNFKGDPKQQVQELLNSGQMTQEQLEQCEETAKWFQSMFSIR
jgi:hypothetical protein